jgi:hypothetical protein
MQVARQQAAMAAVMTSRRRDGPPLLQNNTRQALEERISIERGSARSSLSLIFCNLYLSMGYWEFDAFLVFRQAAAITSISTSQSLTNVCATIAVVGMRRLPRAFTRATALASA